MEKLCVLPSDTRDESGKGRFHGYNLNQLLFSNKLALIASYWKDSIYPSTEVLLLLTHLILCRIKQLIHVFFFFILFFISIIFRGRNVAVIYLLHFKGLKPTKCTCTITSLTAYISSLKATMLTNRHQHHIRLNRSVRNVSYFVFYPVKLMNVNVNLLFPHSVVSLGMAGVHEEQRIHVS